MGKRSQRKNAAMLDSDDDSSVSSCSTVRSVRMSVSGTEDVHFDQDTLLDQALDALDEKSSSINHKQASKATSSGPISLSGSGSRIEEGSHPQRRELEINMDLNDCRDNLSIESSTESSDLDDDLGDLIMIQLIMEYQRTFVDKIPCRTSMLRGRMYTLEVLVGHEARCYDSFRMEKHVFLNFCDALKNVANLKDGKRVSVEEAVAMFLIIVCHSLRHRIVAERFQHSLHTVSKWFRRVLRAVCVLGTTIIRPRNQMSTHRCILENQKYFPYFKDCIGAIDGTHVAAWAPARKQTAFCGRKVLVTQNVMAVCDFDMLFTFVYTGWEETTNDSRVFLDALKPENNFPKPHGDQFYLVDSDYPNMPGYLTPYRGQRYNLQDYRGQSRPRGKHELFNYRHSLLRNVIERCFGVLKARFSILKLMPNYPIRSQRQILLACCTIHNFIRIQHATDRLFEDYSQEGVTIQGEHGIGHQEGIVVDVAQIAQMAQVRENIANEMWKNRTR